MYSNQAGPGQAQTRGRWVLHQVHHADSDQAFLVTFMRGVHKRLSAHFLQEEAGPPHALLSRGTSIVCVCAVWACVCVGGGEATLDFTLATAFGFYPTDRHITTSITTRKNERTHE